MDIFENINNFTTLWNKTSKKEIILQCIYSHITKIIKYWQWEKLRYYQSWVKLEVKYK